jgi:diaminohydroxyphosphoribosylaminopyrimidine deaminase/5-amino-6-(5-phosphoribosylamino)uracil reductase
VVLLRSSVAIGPDGIDALEGLPLTALTQSAQLRSRGVERLDGDTVETFERM